LLKHTYNIHVWSTSLHDWCMKTSYGQHRYFGIRVWTLVSKERYSIVFANQLPFNIITYAVKNWLYHNYTKCFYKSNFEMYFCFNLLLKWSKWKRKKSKFYTCMINKHTKFQKQLKEKCWMSLFNNNSKGFNDMICK